MASTQYRIQALDRSSCLRIIVQGYIIRGPLGGMVWSNLQYLMGLARLGHEVYFVEDSDDYPSCYDPGHGVTDVDPGYGLEFAHRVLSWIGLEDRWAYYDAHTDRWHGPCAERVQAICASADLLLNLCGINPVRPWVAGIPCRVLIDEDPVFTQIRHLTEASARQRALQHTAFFSFGENFGRAECTIPDDGLPWRPTRQPVVLDTLVPTAGPASGKFTTVMQWESYPAREYRGIRYGMKSDSFPPYLELPRRTTQPFELAIGGSRAPRVLLESKGWTIRDPLPPTRDPWTYQGFVQGSKAEFSVAKHGYVVSRSGWFSERSACYMASGRPVVVQDAGFSAWLPTGAGVFAFTSLEEAVAGVEAVSQQYEAHSQAARALANEYFDSRRILAALITDAFEPTTVRPNPARITA